ncbi:MAG: glycosyltransferase family 39 protein [Deltaproteobacteria bacterium]|nr:glycosyltransferase family 39 protein [Deltaproteobacteria bacterium]
MSAVVKPRLPTEPPIITTPKRRRLSLARLWGLIPVAIIVALFALRAGLHDEPLERLAPTTRVAADPLEAQVLVGSLDIARGGPVVIGFQADGPVRLVVGTREIHNNNRFELVRERIVLPRGPIAIRLAAAPSAHVRLLWNPVGRRGDPEYLPASSLSPEHPELATFTNSGAAPLDGAVAFGILVTLIGAGLVFARRRLAAVSRTTWIAMAAVFAVGIGVRLVGGFAFGQTWDEDVNWAAGRNYITNLVGLDFSHRSWTWNFEHPPVMKYLEGIGAQFEDGFGVARALSAVWSSLGCALLVPIGTRLFRPRVGILAASIATLLPPLVAHGQIVGHEWPTVLWWTLGITLALGVLDYLASDDRIALRQVRVRLVWVGAVVGLAIASRFVNGLLGPLVAAIILVQTPARWRRATLTWGAILLPLAAILTFYLLWPRLWTNPVGALAESIKKLDTIHPKEPFLGVLTNHPGPHYFIVYLFATLPLGVLLTIPTFLWRAIAERTKPRSLLVVALWFVVPLLVVISPVRQDGVRYVMPCVVALAMIAAAGLDHLATQLERFTRHAFTALGVVLLAYLAIVLARIHPYYLDYFGEHTGGAGVVAERRLFETAWWGEGVDRAVDYVNAHAAPNARVHRNCIAPAHLAWFREDLWTPMVTDAKQAAWIVAYSTAACPIPADAREVYRVTIDGMTLATVYQR